MTSFSIPSGTFTLYHDVCDELLTCTYTSSACTIYYPPRRIACDNCEIQHFSGQSKAVYKHGGPAPFYNGKCPLCHNSSTKEIEDIDSIRLRIYWQSKDWIRPVGNIVAPNAVCQVIGFATDLPKLLKANEIELIADSPYLGTRFQLEGNPFMHGFGKNRYFIAYLKQV